MRRADTLMAIRKYVRRKGYLLKLLQLPLSERQLSITIYEAWIGVAKECLLRGDSFVVQKFGRFKLVYNEAFSTYSNLLDGEQIDVPAKVELVFTPSRHFTKLLNKRLL